MQSSSKIEILRELQKELENRKPVKSFFNEDYLSIEFDQKQGFIYSNWKGYQTESSVKNGCEKLLEALHYFHCFKILNDNTNVVGIWTPASPWVGKNWLPRMLDNGLKAFAWVYSPAMLSQVSTDEALKHAPSTEEVKTFRDIYSAIQWLNNVPDY